MKQITKQMKLSELSKFPQSTEVLFRHGLYCIGCHAAQFETIEQGCQMHGIDPDEIVKELNQKIMLNKTTKKKPKKKPKTKPKRKKR